MAARGGRVRKILVFQIAGKHRFAGIGLWGQNPLVRGQNYQQLKDELGLDHFEGRSWNGWHRHLTLTMMAFAFLVLEGFRAKKNFWKDLAPGQAGTTAHDFSAHWFLPELLSSIHN
jgi:hypothetical protein